MWNLAGGEQTWVLARVFWYCRKRMKLFNNPAFYETLTYCAYYVPCTILVALETLTYLIHITTPEISSVIISTFWRRKLRHRNLPKVMWRYGFRAHVFNFCALLNCQSVAIFWRRDLRKGKSSTTKRPMEPLARTWIWRYAGSNMLILPVLLLFVASSLKVGYWNRWQLPKGSTCLTAQAPDSEPGGWYPRIRSANNLLPRELPNISFFISKMKVLDRWCFYHCKMGKAARVHDSRAAFYLVLSKIMWAMVPGIGQGGVTKEGMIGVPAGD